MFERLKRLFDLGKLSIDGLKNAVSKNLITPEEYEIIAGEKYNG